MSLIKVIRHGQITLPARLRRALQLKEGDYLEAEIQGNAIVLKPTMVVDREQAIQGLHQLMDEIQARNEEVPEEEVARDVEKALRAVRTDKG